MCLLLFLYMFTWTYLTHSPQDTEHAIWKKRAKTGKKKTSEVKQEQDKT